MTTTANCLVVSAAVTALASFSSVQIAEPDDIRGPQAPLTIAEYLEQYEPAVAVCFPYDEWVQWVPTLRKWLDETEANFGFRPNHGAGGVREYHPFLLAWALDTWSSGTRCLSCGPGGVAVSNPWLTTHTAAPIASTTAEQRALVNDPEYRWEPMDLDFVV